MLLQQKGAYLMSLLHDFSVLEFDLLVSQAFFKHSSVFMTWYSYVRNSNRAWQGDKQPNLFSETDFNEVRILSSILKTPQQMVTVTCTKRTPAHMSAEILHNSGGTTRKPLTFIEVKENPCNLKGLYSLNDLNSSLSDLWTITITLRMLSYNYAYF